jgi:hypothetical protein
MSKGWLRLILILILIWSMALIAVIAIKNI